MIRMIHTKHSHMHVPKNVIVYDIDINYVMSNESVRKIANIAYNCTIMKDHITKQCHPYLCHKPTYRN